jgi:hypothetical protein
LSEIRATTISDAAGTGPISLTGQIAAKAWARYDGSSILADSFNVASTVDGATTGQTTVNFTNDMSDGNYAAQGTCNGTTGDRFVSISNQAASSYDTYTFDGVARTELPVGTMVTGDLA